MANICKRARMPMGDETTRNNGIKGRSCGICGRPRGALNLTIILVLIFWKALGALIIVLILILIFWKAHGALNLAIIRVLILAEGCMGP